MSKVNFQITPKAIYAAIAYSYLAGLNPKDYICRDGEHSFTFDRDDSLESKHIEDFFSGDTRRKISAMKVVCERIFPTYESFVDALSHKLQYKQKVAELETILEEVL